MKRDDFKGLALNLERRHALQLGGRALLLAPLMTGLFLGPFASVANAAPAQPWRPLSRAVLDYDMKGRWHTPVSGEGRIDWRYDAQAFSYGLDLSISAMLMSFSYASKGFFDATKGLLPVSYREKRPGRDRWVVIDHSAKEVRFDWKPGDVKEMPEGIQDVASVMMQITFLMVKNPERVRPGERFKFPMARMGAVKFWTFEVVDLPVIETSIGKYQTWHIRRLRENEKDSDLKIEFWLAPELFHLPQKMAFRMNNEVHLDIFLRKVRQIAA